MGSIMANARVMVSCVGVFWCWGKICFNCLWCTSAKAAISTKSFALAVMVKNAMLISSFRGYFIFPFCRRSAWFISFRFFSMSPMFVRFYCIVCKLL